MYNNSGALGQIDEILRPYYERDVAAGILTDEEATYHLASLLIKETHYMQVGGPDPTGTKDLTSRVSFLVLEAAHRLRIPSNIAVRVHDKINPDLYDMAVRHLFEDKTGSPLWMGAEALDKGFARNGYSMELARERVKCGCHWCALPGREYTLNDIVKINFAAVFDAALHDMMGDAAAKPSVEVLWQRFEKHLRRAVEVTAEGIDFHLAHYKDVHPELVLDLFCFGTVEKGHDVSDGGVEFYNMCVDGAAIATAADSFAAVEQRIEKEKRLSWAELLAALDSDYRDAEPTRLMLKTVPHYGTSGALANEWATRVSSLFVQLVKEKPTPGGKNMIPGLFSWASTIPMGKAVSATPNGRHAFAPISHGPNPDPGWPKPLTPTALSRAVASVECGYGNTAPLQLDMDPGIGDTDATREKIGALIRTHFAMGGTMINLNVLNKQQILEAHEDPSRYPELVVRVTGFSAYFASLSKEFRQLVVDRIVSEE
jgi:formate C-acetyltransferase